MVFAVMLVDGRAAMVQRAARAFAGQTVSARLLIYDSGALPVYSEVQAQDFHPAIIYVRGAGGRTIGALRNAANKLAVAGGRADIIVHMDSDDWSHPRRIEEQVALLKSSGRPCVGYNDVLFWETDGAAWMYSNENPFQPIGASLCYWRQAWEAKPFLDLNKGEDERWLSGMRALAMSSLVDEPRLICALHDSNTSSRISKKAIGKEWNRAVEWDAHCQEAMKL